jgi:glucosamine-6-phosphate deaminase
MGRKGMLMNIVDTDVKHFRVGTLKLEVYPDRKAAGSAAAQAAAAAMKELGRDRGSIGVIFATGASQLDMLEALTEIEGLPWERVRGFHMDEYIGIDPEHPASFRRYLRERLTQKVQMQEFSDVDGNAANPEQAGHDYAAKLASADPQLCFLGIGENGHLAFNDPAAANFEDPLDVKVVQLDTVCRKQQAAEGWFESFEDVPKAAITITIPALLRVPKLIVSVPGTRKAEIMRRALEEPISTECPATILRTHPDATIYLDIDSAAELDMTRFSTE